MLSLFLRIDARSLGLFRIAFGAVLIWDLCRRWRWLEDFYSNDGVLPNHNHLYNLRGKVDVFSVYHAFSSVGEAHFAFAMTLLFYAAFTIGYRTRAFHALSLVCLVSLSARNLLAENAGNYLAIGLGAFSLWLPLGSRLSVDSLARRMRARREKHHEDLNDRAEPPADEVRAARLPGWSPMSVAALALLFQIGLAHFLGSYQQTGAWKDGTALSRALYLQAWVSDTGLSLRGGHEGLLSALTSLVHYAGFAVPVLLLVPVGLSLTRGLAVLLVTLHALTLGVLFDFGLYPWALFASAALLVPGDTWDRLAARTSPRRARTVIYDADCGVCLLLCRVLKRLDAYQHLTFQGNDALDALLERRRGGELVERKLPKAVTAELCDATVVVVDRSGNVATRGRAVAEVLMALPVVSVFGWMLRIPGVSHVLDWAYDRVARRRLDLSVEIGLGACGVTRASESSRLSPVEVTPAARLAHRLTAGVRELGAALMLVAMLAQAGVANRTPSWLHVPQGPLLEAVVRWPRMLATYDILVPEPPTEQGMMVVDASTRDGVEVDLMTGRPVQLDVLEGPRLGQLWADYLDHIRDAKEYQAYHASLRDHLAREGGPGWDARVDTKSRVLGFDAYWVSGPVGPADGKADAPERRVRLFRYSRGGPLGAPQRVDRGPRDARPEQSRQIKR